MGANWSDTFKSPVPIFRIAIPPTSGAVVESFSYIMILTGELVVTSLAVFEPEGLRNAIADGFVDDPTNLKLSTL